jgi:hypothetical protein
MTALLSILGGRNGIGETLTDKRSQSVLVLIKHIFGFRDFPIIVSRYKSLPKNAFL